MKKAKWIILVILMTFAVVLAGSAAAEDFWIGEEPGFREYVALCWEILKETAVFVPVWLLSLLGLARSFLGENWFPFAEKIPVRVTKCLLTAAAVLLVGALIGEKIYITYIVDSFWAQTVAEERFADWQSVFVWVLFYGMLLYTEQWCIRRKDSLQIIRKKQLWIVITLLMTWLVLICVGGIKLWYVPRARVGDLNTLEDYDLWWFSLLMMLFFLPLWFLSFRKTVRLFRGDSRWLTLSTRIPVRITAVIALILPVLMVWQTWESRRDHARALDFDVPEYVEAGADAHMFLALTFGLALIYMICLLIRQIRRAKRSQ